jgi:hypothetical protein
MPHLTVARKPHVVPFAVFLTLALVTLACGCRAADTPKAHTPLKQVEFMLGCWRGTGSDGDEIEERYSVSAHSIVGETSFLHEDKVVQRETTTINVLEDRVVMVPTVDGRPSVSFTLKPMTEEYHAVFENVTHDFPQRILYSSSSDGGLIARVEGNEKGQAKAMEWKMRHIPCN